MADPQPLETHRRDRISTRALVGYAMFGGLALRLAILARPVGVLDRIFVPDDTYYTLNIARSMARGLGPSANAGTSTSGFQPLLAFVLIPFFRLGANAETALRIDMGVLVVADVCTIAVLAWIAYRLAGPVAGITAAVIWAASPLALAVTFGGLETSLAVLAEMSLVAAWIWARDGGEVTQRWVVAGVIGGLAILARVDAVFLLALLGIFEIVQLHLRRTLVAVGSAALLISPWWLWCWASFGTPVPASGSAVRAHPFIAPWAERIMSVAAGSVASGPFSNDTAVKQYFFLHQVWGVALFVTLVALFAVIGGVAAWRAMRRSPGAEDVADSPTLAAPLGALALFCAALLLFYAWYGFSSYMTRYLSPISAVIALLTACVVSRLVRARHIARSLVSVAAALLIVVAGVSDLHFLTRQDAPTATSVAAYTGDVNSGHEPAIVRAIDSLPRGARVGAWQSGALGYFADKRVQVVNLDGVVNQQAPDMRRDDLMAKYIESQHIDWLVDWSSLEQPFLQKGRLTLNPVPGWSEVGTFEQPNGLRITVVHIFWNPSQALHDFFAHEGSVLIRFEQATAPLAAAALPSVAVCRRLASTTLPALASRAALDNAASHVPDEDLKSSFQSDIEGKYLLLLACSTSETLSSATLAALPRIRDLSHQLSAEIAKYRGS